MLDETLGFGPMKFGFGTHLEMHLISPNEATAIREKKSEGGLLRRRGRRW